MIADIDTFVGLARQDFEFTRETRYLTGIVKLEASSSAMVLWFDDGALLEAAVSDAPDSDCKIVVRATDEQWDALLAEKPQPFYQCLQSSNVKHGLHLSSSNETFAYLPALNRMTTLLRKARKGGIDE
ncbi:hypothetical protein [Rhizobium leguminosarum]|uniref:hypothetical protein n=1 Tax=Rhizobium leguminosarum TaxID=384 RepID=UPI00143F064A|nr:hypothetical protein [Rhizobium leguminosarum]NKL21226.1 hypothetical protein [Rhizobium leguminosarum bv. viciae]NKL56733.1 hypothetical protein [Rhizobium leguminosarum bv. viciae]